MTTALVYVRQSRHKDYERTVSPEVQEEACRALPAVAACDTVEVFRDLDISGKSVLKRTAFRAFLDRIAAETPGVVAAYDQSRSFRNTTEALEFYAFMERLPAVRVVYAHGRFDRSPVGEFSYTALAAAHTMERRMTGEKIRDAKRYAAARGEMVGAVPCGYRRRKEGTATVVELDEDAAPIVRRVFEEYASGQYSARELARRLNAEGAIPATFKGGWRADTITQLVANPAYIGLTYVNRRYREGEPIKGNWPALIGLGTWQAVQDRLGPHHGQGGRKFRQYSFKGLLRCVCGARLHGHFIRGMRYYYCRRTDLAEPCPGGHGVREDELLPQARSIFAALDGLKPDGFEQARDSTLADGSRRRAPDAARQIEAAMARATEAFVRGWWTEEQVAAERARLEALKAEIDQEAKVKEATIRLAGILDAWDRGDEQARRDLLGCLFDELHVRDRVIVGYTPRKDRAAEVTALMERVSTSSPGGIRTRDLSLERAAS